MPKSFQYCETTIMLGTSASENIELIRKSNPSWWWLHLDQVPSGHVVIMTDQITPEAIDFAGHVCFNATGSKKQTAALYFKHSKQYFNVITTRISNLLIDIPGLEQGEVDFKSTHRRKLVKSSIIYKNDI
jgi:hypothetical protein